MILLTQIFNPTTYGVTFIVIGAMVKIIIRRRRFNRRVFYRTYKYPNYLMSEVVPILEWLFSVAAFLLILLGLFIYIWA